MGEGDSNSFKVPVRKMHHRSLKVHSTVLYTIEWYLSAVSRFYSTLFAVSTHILRRDTALHRNTAWDVDRFYWIFHQYLLPLWAAKQSNVCAAQYCSELRRIIQYSALQYTTLSRSLSIFCAHMSTSTNHSNHPLQHSTAVASSILLLNKTNTGTALTVI